MKKSELFNISEMVRTALEHHPETRSSDDALYLQICRYMAITLGVKNVDNMPLAHFWSYRKAIGFPPFESVRRSRQKMQAKFPHLAAAPAVEDGRAVNEMIYREYSRT